MRVLCYPVHPVRQMLGVGGGSRLSTKTQVHLGRGVEAVNEDTMRVNVGTYQVHTSKHKDPSRQHDDQPLWNPIAFLIGHVVIVGCVDVGGQALGVCRLC